MKAEDENRMAWEIVQRLDKLTNLLWVRYGDDFMDLYTEEEEERAFASELPEEP